MSKYEDALNAIQNIETDINMLKDGSWEPDNDSCDATLEMVNRIKEFLTSIKGVISE
jgi:hypothetical protein